MRLRSLLFLLALTIWSVNAQAAKVFLRNIVIDNSANGSSTASAQLPVLLNSGNLDFSLIGDAAGADLRVYASDGTTTVPFWVQNCDKTNSTAVLWVKQSITNGTKTTLKLYAEAGGANPSSYSGTFTKLTADANTVALYHFDEGAGSSLTDATGTYPGTILNAPTWIGADGGSWGTDTSVQLFSTGDSVHFNGTSQSVSIPGLLDTPIANGTIECWFKLVSLVTDGRIWSKYTTSASPHYNAIDARFLASGKILIGLTKDDVSVNLTSTTVPTVGQPYHLAFKWDGSFIYLYLNGEMEDKQACTVIPNTDGTKTPFKIAAISQATVGAWQNITIDEMRVSNKARTNEEIQASVQRRTPIAGHSRIQDRLTAHANVIVPSFAGDQNSAQELSVYWNGSIYQGWAHVGWAGPNTIGYWTSTNGTTWTRITQNVLGNGTGGESDANAARAHVVVKGGIYYMFYDIGTTVKYATSSDGVTWTAQATSLITTAQVTGSTIVIGPAVMFDTDLNKWIFVFQAYVNFVWKQYLATRADLAGAFTVDAIGNLTTLNEGSAGSGGYSLTKQTDGRYVLFYHSGLSGVLPTHGVVAYSYDLKHWQRYPFNPIRDISFDITLDQQTADLYYWEANGTVFLSNSNTDNTTPHGTTSVSTFSGTLAGLLTDVPAVTVSVPSTAVQRRTPGSPRTGSRQIGSALRKGVSTCFAH